MFIHVCVVHRVSVDRGRALPVMQVGVLTAVSSPSSCSGDKKTSGREGLCVRISCASAPVASGRKKMEPEEFYVGHGRGRLRCSSKSRQDKMEPEEFYDAVQNRDRIKMELEEFYVGHDRGRPLQFKIETG